MKQKGRLILLFCFVYAGIMAQETKQDSIFWRSDSLNIPALEIGRMLPDTSAYHLNPDLKTPLLQKDQPDFFVPESDLLVRNWDHLSYIRKTESQKPLLPFEFTPDLNFNLGASYWELPVLGATVTFSPVFTYSPVDKLFFYGGVNFTQYSNLSYVQNMLFPGTTLGSNIGMQAFSGVAYQLHERITLRGTYQQSLYNPLPVPLKGLAPSFQMATFGADVDLWKGLGVTVEQVWQFDQSGRMRQGMRYSPYINVDKFVKFLKGD